MSIDLTNLLLSLADAVAQAVNAAGGSVTVGGNLFVHHLPATVQPPAAVWRVYGGPVEGELRPVPVVSVQCLTVAPGEDAAAGMDLARRMYDALHDPTNNGRPRQSWAVPAKTIDPATGALTDDATRPQGYDIRLIVLGAGPPGVIGRRDADAGGGFEIVFNFDVRFSDP